MTAIHITHKQPELKLYNHIIKRDAWENLSALYLTAVDTKQKGIVPQLDVIRRNWHHFRTQSIDFH